MRDTTIKLCLILILPPASVYGQTSGPQPPVVRRRTLPSRMTLRSSVDELNVSSARELATRLLFDPTAPGGLAASVAGAVVLTSLGAWLLES